MLCLETLEDINNYYKSKNIEPYWTVFEDKYLLKLHHIIGITKMFDELINLYPDIKFNGIGDFYTYEEYLYKNYKCKSDPFIKEPTYEKDMLGNYYDFMVGGKYFEKDKVLIINHDSLSIISDNMEKLCSTVIHEFYHALDDKYKIYENVRFIEIFEDNFQLEKFTDRQLKEFGAREFTRSYIDKVNKEESEVRNIIEYIINSK